MWYNYKKTMRAFISWRNWRMTADEQWPPLSKKNQIEQLKSCEINVTWKICKQIAEQISKTNLPHNCYEIKWNRL